MKIAMSGLSSSSYGGQTHFENLVSWLSKIDDKNEYHIFVLKDNQFVKTIEKKNFVFYERLSSTASGLKRFLWEQTILPIELKRKKIDIMFSTKNFNVIAAPCQTIITVLNVFPFCYKNYQNHWKTNLRCWLQFQLTKISLRKANRVIAVSQTAKKYIEDIYHNIGDKSDVIYFGSPSENKFFDPKLHYEKKNFLLSSSKYISYSNQLNLAKGYALLNQRVKDLPPLWLAGGISEPGYFNKVKKYIRDHNLMSKIKILGLIPHEQLLELYSQALIFIFPSRLEACPNTLIEAMAYGAPIITSTAPPMPEICGKAAIYFNPTDPQDIQDKMFSVLNNPSRQKELAGESLKRAKYFNWGKTARDTMEVFNKIYQDIK